MEQEIFEMKMTIPCYCGHKVKINYNETKGKKQVTCKYCGYNHMDSVYFYRSELKKFILDRL